MSDEYNGCQLSAWNKQDMQNITPKCTTPDVPPRVWSASSHKQENSFVACLASPSYKIG